MPLVTLPDGRQAQYWSGGAPVGPVVLFFHGCPDSRWAARTGEAAAREVGVRLVCVNRPGYGRSDLHASTHQTAADDAVTVADRLGIGELAALGMSVGGGYAAACAAIHPDRVSALGVMATLLPPDQAGIEPIEAQMESYRPEFERFVAAIDPADPDDAALAARWTAVLPPDDARLLAATLSAPDLARAAREALVQREGFLRDAALTHRPWGFDVSDIRCPTHLWYGELDQRARSGGDWLAHRIPGARLVVRPGATHLATLLAYWDDALRTLLDSR